MILIITEKISRKIHLQPPRLISSDFPEKPFNSSSFSLAFVLLEKRRKFQRARKDCSLSLPLSLSLSPWTMKLARYITRPLSPHAGLGGGTERRPWETRALDAFFNLSRCVFRCRGQEEGRGGGRSEMVGKFYAGGCEMQWVS